MAKRDARKTPTTTSRRGRPSPFGKTGAESVVAFVRAAGPEWVSSTSICEHWKVEGRKGMPYVLLSRLTKDGVLKRWKSPLKRAAWYTIASGK